MYFFLTLLSETKRFLYVLSRDSVQGNEKEKIFNYRLSRARNVVENAFGILVRRFRLYERRIAISQEHLQHVVLATCTLHNYLKEDTCYWNESDMTISVSNAESLLPMRGAGGQAGSEAVAVRDVFRDYFNSIQGSVQWQQKRICAGKQLA